MQDPTVPPPGDRWPSDPPPTPKQDHAVLAWLAVEADLPVAVQVHLLDALAAWTPLMGPHLFPIEPKAGVDCDLGQVLDAIWWRRSDQGVDASWEERVALYEVRGRLALALSELRYLGRDDHVLTGPTGCSVIGRPMMVGSVHRCG